MTPTTRNAVLWLTLVALAVPPRALAYTGVLLHPSSMVRSEGAGISDDDQVGFGSTSTAVDTEHALLWTGTAGSVFDLHPTGYKYSQATGTDNSKHVGFGATTVAPTQPRALLWLGTNPPTDLHPTSGYAWSKATAISATRQVGYGLATPSNRQHALLWTSSAASVVDLHPAGFNESNAWATISTKQAGTATLTSGINHAILWGTTAASVVDLHPTTEFSNSYAFGLTSSNQVGYGTTTAGADHALIWSGTAASKVDLHPTTGYSATYARALNDDTQVGYGITTAGSADHALLWHNTAASVVDLHSLLSGLGITFTGSRAMGISDDGNIVGWAKDAADTKYAVMWAVGVAGDYNNNGKVDTADYVVWRNGTNPLPNEVSTFGSNTPEDYTAWRARFGNTAASGSSQLGAVPEPSAVYLVACGLIAAVPATIRRRAKPIDD